MPLDTSTYSMARLRVDGRRWNELRRINGQISTQAAADGSSSFEMGLTKVLCTVTGPREQTKGGGGGRDQSRDAKVDVEISIAAFSGMDRNKRSKTDKRTQEMQYTISSAFTTVIFTNLYPHSTITINLFVLSQDGGLLAACLNAATLALIDAGVPMSDYVAAITAGTTAPYVSDDEDADPLLDLNGSEEVELPFLTVANSGGEDKINTLLMETRVHMRRFEPMLAAGLDGCKQVRAVLDGIVRAHGKKILDAKVTDDILGDEEVDRLMDALLGG